VCPIIVSNQRDRTEQMTKDTTDIEENLQRKERYNNIVI